MSRLPVAFLLLSSICWVCLVHAGIAFPKNYVTEIVEQSGLFLYRIYVTPNRTRIDFGIGTEIIDGSESYLIYTPEGDYRPPIPVCLYSGPLSLKEMTFTISSFYRYMKSSPETVGLLHSPSPISPQIDGPTYFGEGTFDGSAVTIYATGNDFIYVQNTSVGVQIPIATVNTFGTALIYRNFELKIASSDTFQVDIPCVETQSTNNGPSYFTFPPTFSFKNEFYQNIDLHTSIDQPNNRFAAKAVGIANPATFINVYKDDTLYNWMTISFPITPPPCFSSTAFTFSSLYIGSPLANLPSPDGPIEVYPTNNDLTGPSLFFSINKTTPLVAEFLRFYNFKTTVIDNEFTTPTVCIPLDSLEMNTDQIKQASSQAPIFPPTFTTYIHSWTNGQRSTIYYNALTEQSRYDSATFTRIVTNGTEYIFPTGNILKRTSNQVPCSVSPNTDFTTLFEVPQLTRALYNVTFYARPAKLWQSQNIGHWYIANDGTPLMSVFPFIRLKEVFPQLLPLDMLVNQYTFFDASPPPPGVFDIPSFCL